MGSNRASGATRSGIPSSLGQWCCCYSVQNERRSQNSEHSYQQQETGADVIRHQPILTSGEMTNGPTLLFDGKMKKLKSLMKRKPPIQELKVGIFSRSAECEYQWLKTSLGSGPFHKTVLIVRSCPITNNGFQQFLDDVSWCDFGILYHTKNRGRINVTDVRDSLYNVELEHLSEKLDKKNVIVVIDDVTDNSEEEKNRILGAQPKLRRLAQEVFFFSTEEKKEQDK
ncbi:uncharacterized protein [Dendropsophus ebraccatus]|uniref:uncharacterized protein n=1 Tax=Dendropsophus ebraccatus TaxID=150705 RepID=UPI0038319492